MDKSAVDILVAEYNSCRTETRLHLQYNYITIAIMIGYASSVAGFFSNKDAPDFMNQFSAYAALPYFAVSIGFYTQLIYIARLSNYVHVDLNERIKGLGGPPNAAFGWEEYVNRRRGSKGGWVLGVTNIVFKAMITLGIPLLIFFYGRSRATGSGIMELRGVKIFISDFLNAAFALYVLYLMWHTALLFTHIADDRSTRSDEAGAMTQTKSWFLGQGRV